MSKLVILVAKAFLLWAGCVLIGAMSSTHCFAHARDSRIKAARLEIEGVQIIFMEPESSLKSEIPTCRRISAPDRLRTYAKWIDNQSARMAMDLYGQAWRMVHKRNDAPIFFIALVRQGNHPALGFRLREGSARKDYSTTIYIKLDPDKQIFNATLLHETGHIILYMLNGGDGFPVMKIASISHSTAALTDRSTAFNEGFAIHLETLAAHLGSDASLKDGYQHQTFLFGVGAKRRSEYYRQSMDLLTYAQTRTRYYDVRENSFAFAPAYKGPDYLRVQLEKTRDFATLRDANQLLQSEGFYATFFFSFAMRGNAVTRQLIRARQDQMISILTEMFRSNRTETDTPYLLRFVETSMRMYPAAAGEVADVLLDLSHGIFVDSRAAALWREHYLGALRLDLAERDNEKLNSVRSEWRTSVLKNPQILYSRIGAQLPCKVPSVSVRLIAFGDAAPLSFDVNTVDEGIMRMIPGITESHIARWLSERADRPFTDSSDFTKRSALSERVLANLSL